MSLFYASEVADIYRLAKNTLIEDVSDDAYIPMSRGIRCHLSAPQGGTSHTPERTSGTKSYHFQCDIIDLRRGDRVKIDDTFYTVTLAYTTRSGPMPHTSAEITETEGGIDG